MLVKTTGCVKSNNFCASMDFKIWRTFVKVFDIYQIVLCKKYPKKLKSEW